MKKLTISIAILAIAGVASAGLLVPNGDFETAGGAGWINDGPAVVTYPAAGGNGGGYADMDSTGGWGVLVIDATLPSLGLSAGDSPEFIFDMIGVSGGELAGLKVEAWDGGGHLSNTGDMKFNATTSWATYAPAASWMIPAGTTFLKFVPLSVDGGHVGFDNIGVVPEPATLGLLGLVGSGMLFIRRLRC